MDDKTENLRKKCPFNTDMKCEECVFLVKFNGKWSCNYARCFIYPEGV